MIYINVFFMANQRPFYEYRSVLPVYSPRCVVLDKVECDLYQYLSGEEKYSQLFEGGYLTNYSWGETTLGELINH